MYYAGPLDAPSNFSVNISNTSNTTFLLSWGAPFSLDVTDSPDIFYYTLCTNITIYGCRTIPSDPDCIFNGTNQCNSSVDFTDHSLNGTIERQNTTMDYDSIYFTFFAVNGAGNGTKANFTYLFKKESGENLAPNQTEPKSTIIVPTTTTLSSNHNSENLILKVAVPVVVGILIVGVLIIVIVIKTRGTKRAPSELPVDVELYSYQENTTIYQVKTSESPCIDVACHPIISIPAPHHNVQYSEVKPHNEKPKPPNGYMVVECHPIISIPAPHDAVQYSEKPDPNGYMDVECHPIISIPAPHDAVQYSEKPDPNGYIDVECHQIISIPAPHDVVQYSEKPDPNGYMDVECHPIISIPAPHDAVQYSEKPDPNGYMDVECHPIISISAPHDVVQYSEKPDPNGYMDVECHPIISIPAPHDAVQYSELNKNKEGCPPDIRPIAVGETIRRLTGKCMCALVKDKATEFFQPLQLGVACHAGAEKVAHALRGCIEEHWMDEDFVVLKVDMRNAFNIVSRQAVLDECATFFPELLPWVSWCYGTHPLLWHPLVLQKLVSSLDADEECAEILLQAWYLDDGALAGTRSAVLHALHVIQELGPALGLHVNLAKCEMFSRRGNTSFPPEVRCSLLPNLDILGAPIGDYLHCSKFIAGRCAESRKLLSGLVDVAAVDLQVAVSLLRMCGSFCRMVHIARVTPPSLASDGLRSFDEEVKQCFVMCSAINVTNDAWSQAQLGLKFGGLGLRSLSHHAAAAFIASLSFSGFGKADNIHLKQAVAMFNTQKVLSGLIQAQHFHILLESSSPANRARLLSVAAPHASSWLSVVPSPGLGLHLESNEFQMAIRWWLGLDTSGRSMCPFCPDTALDPLGHHAVTCRHGGMWSHAIIVYEMRDLAHTRPADFLIAGWDRGKPVALDLTITSPLCSVILGESCYQAGAAALAAETRKLHSNGPKCQELGWSCIPLAVETYGNWGKQAHDTFSRLASFLAIHQSSPKAVVVAEIYGRLNVVLVRSIARAILARELPPS
eukprot:Em0001g2958a